jgi:spore germination protein KC
MKKKILFLIVLCLFLTGCWDKQELNELAIVMALGVDKVEDEYLVSVQVVVPGEVSSTKGGTGRSPVTLLQAKGETINEAIRKLATVSPRKMYLGHLQIVVIGEPLAEEGIASLLDFLSRYWETRADFYLMIARDNNAEKILNVQTTIESIPANHIFDMLHTAERRLASASAMTFADLIIDTEREGKEGVLTGIYVLGEQESGSSKQNVESITPSAHTKIDGVAVFKEDKLLGWLTENESRAYNAVVNDIKTSIGTVSCPKGGKVSIDISNFNSKLKSMIVNGKPEIEVDIKISGNLGDVDCNIDISKEKTIKMLEKLYEEEVEKDIIHTIKVVQDEFGSDIFGFGANIHQNNPTEWNKIKNNWDAGFSELPVNVKVKAEIRHSGSVINPIQENIKE